MISLAAGGPAVRLVLASAGIPRRRARLFWTPALAGQLTWAETSWGDAAQVDFGTYLA